MTSHGAYQDRQVQVIFQGPQKLQEPREVHRSWCKYKEQSLEETQGSTTQAAEDQVSCASQKEETYIYGEGAGNIKAEYGHPGRRGVTEREKEGQGVCG